MCLNKFSVINLILLKYIYIQFLINILFAAIDQYIEI